MKAPSLRAVDMVRRIRDAQTRALARKSPEAVLEYYRAAGARAAALAMPRKAAHVPANKALQPTSRAGRAGRSTRRARAARG
jgi:hypothetical protein